MSHPFRSEIKPLLKLAIPMSAAQVANLAMQLVDAMFIGRVNAVALGGVSVGNAVFATFMVVGLGSLFGLDFLISHAFGARKISDCHRYLVQGLYVAFWMALISAMIMFCSTGFFVRFGIAADIAEQASVYLKTLSWSLIPFLLFMTLRSYLQAMGNAMPMFVVLVVANLVNIFANWAFVFGHLGFSPMGVHGSGLATCVARVFMLVSLGSYVLWRDKKLGLGLTKVSRKFDARKVREILVLGLPSAGQLLLEVGVFATATLLAGRLGAVPLSSHQIVLHVASVTFMIPLGLSGAAAVRLGQSLGHGEFDRAANIGWLSILFGGLGGAIFALSVFGLSSHLLRVFTNDVAIIQLGSSLLLIAALFQISDGVQVVGTGVLRGIGNTSTSLYVNFAGHWLIGLPIGAFLCFGLKMGVQGLWIGLSVGLTFVAIVLSLYWKSQVPKVLRGEFRHVEAKPGH